ncbi:MAG: 4-(cytidine 5'-diphospho)-2-C-methyl-D-erythritol kinase [Bacteroidales bacterium]
MIYFPPCKINIGLHILSKRSDAYHNLETAFFPLSDISDVLEISPSEKEEFLFTGIPITGEKGENLVVQAANLLSQYTGKNFSCRIHLHKAIPFGSGLGGGSADATYTLLGINETLNLGLSQKEIYLLCTELGSDCACFVENKPTIGKERGNIISPLSCNIHQCYDLLLVIPPISISTKDAYKSITPQSNRPSLGKFITTTYCKLEINYF